MQNSHSIYQRHRDSEELDLDLKRQKNPGLGLYQIQPTGPWLIWSLPPWSRLSPNLLDRRVDRSSDTSDAENKSSHLTCPISFPAG